MDPALFSLSFLDRIEVERWPGQLRVELFTRRHDRLAPRSRIGIARGDRDFARYEADLGRRFESGLGFELAGDYLSSPTASGSSSTYSNTQIWGQGGYIPSPRFGVQYQLVRSAPNRRAFTLGDVPTDTIGAGFKATRTDAQFRVSLRSRDDGTGPGVDLIYARSAWDGRGSTSRSIRSAATLRSDAPPSRSAHPRFTGRRWTSLDLRGTRGLVAGGAVRRERGGGPSEPLTAAAPATTSRCRRDSSRSAALVAHRARARLGEQVVAPAIASDTAQRLRDFEALASWDRERLGLELGWARTSAFSPVAYAEFTGCPRSRRRPRSSGSRSARGSRRSAGSPCRAGTAIRATATVDGIPPTHSLATGTIRSKFLRKFPSGIFDLKLQVGDGSLGPRARSGGTTRVAPINLRGATFFKSLVEIQLQSFTLYWDRGNLTATKLTYVPGFRIPTTGATSGCGGSS